MFTKDIYMFYFLQEKIFALKTFEYIGFVPAGKHILRQYLIPPLISRATQVCNNRYISPGVIRMTFIPDVQC